MNTNPMTFDEAERLSSIDATERHLGRRLRVASGLSRLVRRWASFHAESVWAKPISKSLLVVFALCGFAAMGASQRARATPSVGAVGAAPASLVAAPPDVSAAVPKSEPGAAEGSPAPAPVNLGAKSGVAPAAMADPALVASSAGTGRQGGASSEDPVYLNSATIPELRRLPGIGEKRAQAILSLRERMGHFQKVEDLMKVKGIGKAMIKRLRPLVRLDSRAPAPAPGQLDGLAPP